VLKRTIEVSGWGYQLTSRSKHLKLAKGGQEVGAVPFEDLGVLVLDTVGATVSTAALVSAAEQGCVTILCGADHLPTAIVQPLSGNSLSTQRLIAQANLSQPIKSAMWAQIVRSKIRGQSLALPSGSRSKKRLDTLASNVQPGDRSNAEAQAARVYWAEIFLGKTQGFKRRQDLGGANAMLNYGYAIVRAAMARALCVAGLQAGLGLKHSNRSNAFCLADDFMEPFRPVVDLAVRELLSQGHSEIDPDSKRHLLGVLTHEIRVGADTGPCSVAMQKIAHAYAEFVVRESGAIGPRTIKTPGRRPPAARRIRAVPLPWEG
jgi:CRISP-associated protein Cas1